MTRTNLDSRPPSVPTLRTPAPPPVTPLRPIPAEAPVAPYMTAIGPNEHADDGADAGLGQAFARGAAVGALLVFLVCGGISLLAGASVVAAAGIGLFAGFWGGPGFGGMMGAVLHYDRQHSEH